MVTGEGYLPFFLITAATIAAMFGAAYYAANETGSLPPQSLLPWIVVASGGALNLGAGAVLRKAALWQAFGVVYIAVPALLLVALRMHGLGEFWVVVGLFVAVWATDTGALFAGNILGGPKLVPTISPNKTWAGFLGGIVCAAAAETILIAVLGGHPLSAALYGAGLAVAAHAGDLFESWIKRLFGRKDSGHMIPGHGGILDRIDSSLFVAPVVALLVFAGGLDPLFGASP
jgi:phosphatidate cytidylyltransferase